MNQVTDIIKKRRSIRRYKNKKIPAKIIKEIIEAGRYAPSSHNSQPWRFIVIINRKKIKELSLYIAGWFRRKLKIAAVVSLFYKKIRKELESAKKRVYTDRDMFFYDAPLLILICARHNKFSIKDCSCAAENMQLAARSLGIGACWIGFADLALNSNRKFMSKLGVPKHNNIIATLVFGYPSKFPDKALPRKEDANIINWIK